MIVRATIVAFLLGAGFATGGCLRIATAPLRAERREKAETAFERLALVPPETLAAGLTRRMGEALALTPAQQPQVEAINLNYARALYAVAANADSVREKTRAWRTQRNAKAAELKAIL